MIFTEGCREALDNVVCSPEVKSLPMVNSVNITLTKLSMRSKHALVSFFFSQDSIN